MCKCNARSLFAQILAFLPGGKVMLPELSMQTSTFDLLPTVTECVVSAVTVLLATSSVAVPAGQSVPVESAGAPMVVVLPFNHVMVPPVASAAALSGCEPPPLLWLHPLNVTVLEMLPDSPLHLILKTTAGCDADAVPERPITRDNGVATNSPAVANRASLERNMHLPPFVVTGGQGAPGFVVFHVLLRRALDPAQRRS